ncbi:MAG: SulP family inorganic anion transporter [Synechococcales cyanobacterium]
MDRPAVVHPLGQQKPRLWVASFVPGLIGGMFSVIYCISFAALIYSDALTPYLSMGIGTTLLTGAIVSLVVTAFSSWSAIVAAPQKTTAAILAALAVAVMPETPGWPQFLTVVAAITLSSVLCGVTLWLLGAFRLGQFIRYVPYPVIGGFMAGSGWLTLEGAMRLMTGIPLKNLDQFLDLFTPAHLWHWLPGLGLGLVLLLILPRIKQLWVLPGLILLAIALFFGTVFIQGGSVATVSQQGLLLGPFPQGSLFQWMVPEALLGVDWSGMVAASGHFGTVCLMTVLALLLNASGIELATEQEMNFDQELKAAGMANVLAGLGGGISGFHSLSQSILAHKLGGHTRIVGWMVSVCCVGVMLTGAAVLSVVPKVVVGGMLIFLGLELLVDWVYGGWLRLSRWDYAIVLIIVVTVAAVGFLAGVTVGILLAMISFVVNYSQINVVKRTLTGALFSSNVVRSSGQLHFLKEQGEQIYILELQGMIFFGLAVQLWQHLRDRMGEMGSVSLRYIVLDFALCNGLDVSAVLSFSRLKKMACKRSIVLVLTGLKRIDRAKLHSVGVIVDGDPWCVVWTDLDQGIEWCENQLLQEREHYTEQVLSLDEQLSPFFDSNERHILFAHMEPVSLATDHFLFRHGDPCDGLYFIESGRVSVVQDLANGRRHRLRALTGGHSIGEIGFYRQLPRMASVMANTPCRLYFLSNQQFERLQRNHPAVAASVHKYIATILAERLETMESKSLTLKNHSLSLLGDPLTGIMPLS